MANIIRIGNSSNSLQSITVHTGKINLSNGQIDTSNNDYFYTELLPCPAGYFVMDYGATLGNDAGAVIYEADGATYADYWQANARNRVVNNASAYGEGYKARLGFPKTALNTVYFVDVEGAKVYSTFELNAIAEE